MARIHFRGDSDPANGVVRGSSPGMERSGIGSSQVPGGVGSPAFRIQEWSFEVDSKQAGAVQLFGRVPGNPAQGRFDGAVGFADCCCQE